MDWALLALDNEALLQEGEKELCRLRSTIRCRERQITEHDQLDAPAFRQWKGLICADLLIQKRELEDLLHRLRTRLSFIHAFVERDGYDDGGEGEAEAFFWLTALERGECNAVPPEIRELWESVYRCELGESVFRRKGWTVVGNEPEAAEDRAADPDGTGVDDDDGHHDDYGGDGEESGTEGGPAARIKALYRKIVRVLHPDAAGSLSGDELELWHQMQAAYESGDIVTLELILARCDRVIPKQLRYSELLALVDEARDRLALLEHACLTLTKCRSWRFREATRWQKEVLKQDLRTELAAEIVCLLHEEKTLAARLQAVAGEA
ncbi:MAG: hypothetical protein JO069_04675 [Verrucomicrobia bacterium]|nr:hypothetical protein [Verrucomicrobiota bacterium]